MTTVSSSPTTPILGVKVSYEVGEERREYNIRDWSDGICDFCCLMESKKQGILKIGHVQMEFDLTIPSHRAQLTRQVMTDTFPGSIGEIQHKGQARGIIEALFSFRTSSAIKVLNLRFQEGGLVTISKKEGLIEVTTSNVPLPEK